MKRGLRFFGYILVALFAVYMLVISPEIWGAAELVPNPAVGKVFPLNDHGSVVYVSKIEQMLVLFGMPVLLICAISGSALIFAFSQKR